MTRLVRAEFRKLLSTRLWCWMLLAAAAWTAGYTALAITPVSYTHLTLPTN